MRQVPTRPRAAMMRAEAHATPMDPLLACVGPAALHAAPPFPAWARPLGAIEAALVRARAHTRQGDWTGSLAAFDAAVALEPRFALGHLGRAIALTQLAREAEARAALADALGASRGQERVLVPLARMLAKEGHTGLALPFLAAAVQALPEEAPRLARDPLFADHPAYLQVLGVL